MASPHIDTEGTFLVREPGELRIGHQVADGPRREDDES
jgi:hypothetical protein